MPSLRYRPARFFILCVLIPWPLWFAAAYISHQNPSPAMLQAEAALGIAGLVAPALIAARMVLPNPQLRADMAARLLRINGFQAAFCISYRASHPPPSFPRRRESSPNCSARRSANSSPEAATRFPPARE